MALCDDPLAVSTGQDWGAMRPRCRVPIFVTANDLSLLYAVRATFAYTYSVCCLLG